MLTKDWKRCRNLWSLYFYFNIKMHWWFRPVICNQLTVPEICSAVTSIMWKWTGSPWDTRLLWLNNVSSASASVLPEVLLQAIQQRGIKRHLTTVLHISELLQLSPLLHSKYLYMKVSIDCITCQARSLHLDVTWAQPDSNYSVEKIAVQNVSSF